MESKNEIYKNIDPNYSEELNEMILINEISSENKENLKFVQNQNSKLENEEDFISDEEFMLDCSRFGDLNELKNLFIENPSININFVDKRKNNALRIFYK